MKKGVIFLLCAVVLGGCLQRDSFGAIKITTNQPAAVQIDGKDVGQTPYSGDKVMAGEISLRLTPQDTTLQPWDALIDVSAGVWTVVNRTFAANSAQAEGFILTMEPISQAVASIAVVSEPDGAMVRLDEEAIGPTPLEKNQVAEGSHSLTISAPGYRETVVPVSTQNGYKVIVNVKLSKLEVAPIQEIGEATESAEATQSAATTGTPTPTRAAGSPTPTRAASGGQRVRILSTPTGWLRVRGEASVNSAEVGRVDPGDTFDLLDESSGWYKIELDDGTEGWVAGQYADKI